MTVPDPATRPGRPGELAPPPAALAIFGGRLPLARRYAALLAGPGLERGLIGPREADRLWSRHLLNCAVLAELVPPGARVVDVGSGAGLPGIPLAIARPDCRIELLEPLLRRSTFLTEVVAELGLSTCRVLRLRAEDAAADVGGADVVTARAVAALARLARWSAPLLRPAGLLLAIKGAAAADEVERDRAAAGAAGIVDLEVVCAGLPVLGEATTIVRGRRAVGGPARRAGRASRA